MKSTPRRNFEYALQDVHILLDFYNRERRYTSGRPPRDLEVFKRAGVSLVIVAWETYIKDVLIAKWDGEFAPRSQSEGGNKFLSEIFDTPDSYTTKKFFKEYLDLDLIQHWKWQRVNPENVCQKLDALIQLQNSINHRDGEQVKVERGQLVAAINLVEHLVQCTDRVVFP